MIRRNFFLLAGIFISLVIRSCFIVNGSEVADVHSLYEMGDLVLRGINPYIALNYNTYPPGAIYIEAATIKISSFLGLPFYILIKIWPNLADLLITLTLYKFLTKKGVSNKLASAWSLIFFLNPISILISSAHGQIDSIPTFLVVFSLFLLTFYKSGIYIFLSFFLLGLSITIKPNPLILLPIFLVFIKSSLRMKMVYSLVSLSPVVFLLLPFVQDYPKYVLEKILNYSGSYDFGISAILRGLYYLKTADYNLVFNQEILQADKALFLFGLIVITLSGDPKKLLEKCLMVYLFFFTLYLGLSAQYLSWVLPIAVLRKDKVVFLYSLFGTIAILGFYLFINPKIIIAQFSNIVPYQNHFMLAYFTGNVGFWITTLWWFLNLVPRSSSHFLIRQEKIQQAIQ